MWWDYEAATGLVQFRRLEEYLEMPLARIIVRPESVGRWKKADGRFEFDFFRDSMTESGYGD